MLYVEVDLKGVGSSGSRKAADRGGKAAEAGKKETERGAGSKRKR
ncbi:unnamed protein product [Brassica rapa]|uniref:Uncharacterized protein n=1 Tax=Brassica campestris TaxID=3711 RepID=A0A8D9GEQ7_BRACM|nr:unnamed protein product [Brassica rapa]